MRMSEWGPAYDPSAPAWTVENWCRDHSIEIGGRTYRGVWDWLAGELSVGGPRVLTATRSDGAEVCASLYDGEDYARDPLGRDVTYLLDRESTS